MKLQLFFQEDLLKEVDYSLIHKGQDINKEKTIGFKVEFNQEGYLLKYITIIIMEVMKKTQLFYTKQV